MKYRVTHTTTYDYSEPVPVSHNQVFLTPRDGPGQRCGYHRLTVTPHPVSSSKRVDYFGNQVSFFTITRGHKRLRVSSVSNVEVDRQAASDLDGSPPWEEVRERLPAGLGREGAEDYQFCFDSPHVPRLAEIGRYAATSFAPGRPILAAVRDLTARVHGDFAYDPEATTVSTPILEVYHQRRGVCQDLAHFQIGCLRALGLAARYVSGYLRTLPPAGRPRLVGSDASHAWLAVYCGPLGWVDVDPTNDVFAAADHITVSWGRDYSDVCPIRGVLVGGGEHKITVAVDVVPVES